MKYLKDIALEVIASAVMGLIVAVLFVATLYLTGCSQIDAARIQNAMDKTEEVTETVCKAADLFQAAGVPQPVLDTCAKAMTALERDEYVLVSQAVDCVAGDKTKQDKTVCIAGLEGWSAVADKLGK